MHFATISTLISSALLLAACQADAPASREAAADAVDTAVPAGDAAAGDAAQLRFDFPGFDMDVDIPAEEALASRVTVGGVGLYPESEIDSIAVGEDPRDGGTYLITLTFSAPAAVERVRRHFVGGLAETGSTLLVSEPSLIEGLGSDGEHFRIELDIAPEATASGRVVIENQAAVRASDG